MARLERRRRWIKLYPVECLEGSIRYQLEPDERSVWYDLLNYASICANDGCISDRDKRPFPHSFIANRLNIPIELLERTLTKCIEEKRLMEDDEGIHITNWKYYQSEYDRTKGYQQVYRQKQKDHRQAPYETETDFKERLKLYGAENTPDPGSPDYNPPPDMTDQEKLKQGWEIDGMGRWYKPNEYHKQSNEMVRLASRQMVD